MHLRKQSFDKRSVGRRRRHRLLFVCTDRSLITVASARGDECIVCECRTTVSTLLKARLIDMKTVIVKPCHFLFSVCVLCATRLNQTIRFPRVVLCRHKNQNGTFLR